MNRSELSVRELDHLTASRTRSRDQRNDFVLANRERERNGGDENEPRCDDEVEKRHENPDERGTHEGRAANRSTLESLPDVEVLDLGSTRRRSSGDIDEECLARPRTRRTTIPVVACKSRI